jgi:dienelactone hydrolase
VNATLVLSAAVVLTMAPSAPKLARLVVFDLAAGRWDRVVARFDEDVKAALPAPSLAAAWRGVELLAGPFGEIETVLAEERDPYVAVELRCAFERQDVDVTVTFDAKGHIAGLSLRPRAEPADDTPLPGGVREEPVIVGREWPLPGTLTLPATSGPFPAVVLVHGSGPSDRDESVGPNRPFRDVAHGLAERDIAVLRYEKRTREHAARLGSIERFTVDDETVDDAVAAVAKLRADPRIDPKRIFVAGHSLGGMVAPRIAAADPEIAGLIVLAGAVRDLAQSMVDQTRYLIGVDGTISPEEADALARVEALQREVAALTPESVGNVGGAPASYWLDLRGYDPPAHAAALPQPILVLQGERDYQVTMEDFAKWKAALSAHPGAEFRSYPALDHMFAAGLGPSEPSQYFAPRSVDAQVIADIAAWVLPAR